ncbi:hypothetical protein SNE40_008316 [Patella caerulea]|uniref:Uncharacterized protein n=2 Tax=Patella caerulea TaxID=87958 RepID=A0AAN8JYM4_PATCE
MILQAVFVAAVAYSWFTRRRISVLREKVQWLIMKSGKFILLMLFLMVAVSILYHNESTKWKLGSKQINTFALKSSKPDPTLNLPKKHLIQNQTLPEIRLTPMQTLPKIRLDTRQTSPKISLDPRPVLPEITLVVRMTSIPRILNLVYCHLFPSISLYWSKRYGKVALILDKGSSKDKIFAEKLEREKHKMGIDFQFFFESLPKNSTSIKRMQQLKLRNFGYVRQLYSSFLMDTFIKTPVLGWVDSDSKFITPVAPENIMTNGRLRVKGLNTSPTLERYSSFTMQMLGKPLPGDFMCYFPVYIWTDTITNCNRHILKHMNVTTLEEAFIKSASRGLLSPVCIILTYAFYFERHRYDWHFDIGPRLNLTHYNKMYVLPRHEITSADVTYDVHVATHNRYYVDPKNVINRQGYCAAVANSTIPMTKQTNQMCRRFNGSVFWTLFTLQTAMFHMNGWCVNHNPKCLPTVDEHYKNVKKAIKEGYYTLNMDMVKYINSFAKSENVTCAHFFRNVG